MQQLISNSRGFTKNLFRLGLFSLILSATLLHPEPLESANLTSVSNTLQSSRLSVHARVNSAGTSTGSSNVQIQTSGGADTAGDNAYTISTANLHAQDTVVIGSNTYTIVDIIDADEFTVSPVLIAGDTDNNDPIYMNLAPRHVVQFDTASAVADGFFQVLLPADSDATTFNDGLADDSGFDFNTTVDVTAADVGNYDFTAAGVATVSGGTDCTAPANYHCFEVHYSGAGGIGTTITINIGNINGSNTPIAPAAASGHTEATADTYFFIVKNFAAGADPDAATAIDQTSGQIALIESVRVSATVDPTITFTIAGVNTGTSICGATPDIDTTTGVNAPLAVPFGSLALNTFKDAGHNLTVSTNADGGASVTALEDDQLGKDGLTTPFIVDATGDGAMSHTQEDDWHTATQNGFGYALHDDDADVTEAFAYNSTSTGSCTTGTFCARQFPAGADTESAEEIFNTGGTVANAVDLYVCYRISVGATQEAGDYENLITYTATATF